MLYTKVNQHTLSEVSLARHKLWSIDGDRRGDVISCLSGILWITQEGDLKDYVVEAGKDFWVTRQGTVIVQSIEDARFRYSLNELDSHIEVSKQPLWRVNHSRQTRISHRLR